MSGDVQVDDVVRLRKPHPCGSTDWIVVRIGADIGLRCLGCGRRVLIPRPTFRKRLKAILHRRQPAPAPPAGPLP